MIFEGIFVVQNFQFWGKNAKNVLFRLKIYMLISIKHEKYDFIR